MFNTFYRQSLTVLAFFVSLSLLNNVMADDDFPGRKLYKQIKTISKEKLYEKINNGKVVVVDVRSAYEYKTLQILNSINLPVAEKNFHLQLQRLRDSTPKEIVFYCNGRTCYKSYIAGIKALKYNIKNCLSFDAGIFEWAEAYPNLAVLLGETPVNNERIISSEQFNARLLSPEAFEEELLIDNTFVYDIRDREQRRGGSGLFVFRDKSVDLDNDKKLGKIITKAIEKNSMLLFYDQKGKQVRWLQYYLEQKGLENYFFLKGGAGAYYERMKQRHGL